MTATKAPRKPAPKWMPGDIVVIDTTRWQFIGATAAGAVVLEAMNRSRVIWKTTLSKLPRKAES